MKATFVISKINPDLVQLEVSGDLLLTSAKEFQSHLVDLLKIGSVAVNLKMVRSIDTASMQVLKSLANECHLLNKRLTIQWPETKEVYDLLVNTNLLKFYE